MGDPRTIDQYAARQHGVFNTSQLQRADFSRSDVLRRVESGEWVRLAPKVFAVASSPPIWERQMSAAVLSRPRAIVAGSSAAYLHRFSGFGPATPVIMIPWSGNARSPIARVIRSQFFQTVATRRVRGFVVTSPAETVMTLAADVSPVRLESVLDEAILAGLVDLIEYEEVFDRLAGTRVRGLSRMRRLVNARLPGSPTVNGSYLERLLERVLEDKRVPNYAREHPFLLNGTPGRVDVFIPAWRLVIEADSRRWHTRQADF